MFKTPRGLKDILPEEVSFWRGLEEKAREVFSFYGYSEIQTPVMEELDLFSRSLGESSEVVQKQMFIIKRKKENLVLRPEGTASVIRSYLEHGFSKKEGFVKFYYIGPMFRAERPQRGRFRQFHHIGAEAIGSSSPYLDCEIISLSGNFLKEIELKDYEIKVNSVGCKDDKDRFTSILKNKLKGKRKILCQDCQRRFNQNTLRILDCKKQNCKETVKGLNLKNEHLCSDCLLHFKKVTDLLDKLKIGYSVTPSLVRGLDYYTRTVFEITHKSLGSQDALCAGGRYDNLIRDLGGEDIPAVGFAFGIERLLLVQRAKFNPKVQKTKVFIVALGEKAKEEGFVLLDELRKKEISSETDYQNRSLKGQLRKASNLGVRFVIIIGEDELREDRVILKDMISGRQEKIERKKITEELERCLGQIPAEN